VGLRKDYTSAEQSGKKREKEQIVEKKIFVFETKGRRVL